MTTSEHTSVSDFDYVTLWLNYFLGFLDLIVLTLLVRYTVPVLHEWKEPHANFAIALVVWMSGILLLRVSALIRITGDFTCYAHACLGGGALGIAIYNFGSIANAIGLILIVRSIGASHGTYTWLKLVTTAFVVATLSFIMISSIGGIF